MDPNLTILHQGEGTSTGRFVLIDQREEHLELSLIEYEMTPQREMSLTHTYTDPKGRGKGYAALVTQACLDWAKAENNVKVVPVCWYVKDVYLPKHPEYNSML